MYVDDVVAANVAAIEADWQGSYNVGTGVETSVNALYGRMASQLSAAPAPEYAAAKPGEQMRSVLDGRRLRALPGSRATFTPLETGLPATVEWFAARCVPRRDRV